jgi:hypothetical protein|tara:strand:- start:16 stop:1143 length:1128 start_codon:yes stop_codon:yes gene_type:complete
MDIKVKEVSLVEEKSAQEIEAELLKKHEEETQAAEQPVVEEPVKEDSTTENPAEAEAKEKTPSSELNDEDVLSYIKNRYDKEINSVDDLFAQQKANEELPEDVSAYFKYKKETGRGIEDFVALQKDYNSMEDDQVLANYYRTTEDGLDAIDIQDMIEEKFMFDTDLDEPKDVKKKKLAKKRELAKAKKFLNEQKDKYKVPLESSGGGLSEDQEKNLNAYKSYKEESEAVNDLLVKRHDFFLKKTDEVFSDGFKGFEYNVGEKSFTFKPGDAAEVKNRQADFLNFVSKFQDKDGMMVDAKGYHRALAAAMNPEKFAQFFYDQGVATTVESVAKKSKNIDMEVRPTAPTYNKDGLKIRAVGDTSSGRGLKIRSIKKV